MKHKRSKQNWTPGDVFEVVLQDKTKAVGQIIAKEQRALNSVSCAFFDLRLPDSGAQPLPEALDTDRIFSVLFVTRDLLDLGVWKVVANKPVTVPRAWFPYEHLRESGYIGASIQGSRIVTEFLNAYYGLVPWDDWKDPAYLDQLLLSPEKKPQGLIYKKPKP